MSMNSPMIQNARLFVWMEKTYQLLGEAREPLPMIPRSDVSLKGWRYIIRQNTAADWTSLKLN